MTNLLIIATAFYVSIFGNDAGKGTEADPFATITKARDTARVGDTVYLSGGVHKLSSPLVFESKHSGVTYKAYQNEKPVISGGVMVMGWQQVSLGLYRAPLDMAHVRQLYVNGVWAPRAASSKPVLGQGREGKDVLLFTADDLPPLSGAEDVELVSTKAWKQHRVCVSIMQRSGDFTFVTMDQPYFSWSTDLAAETERLTGKEKFRVENSLDLLDEPGEWYFDRKGKQIYYAPRPGEDMGRVEVYVPEVETLVAILGTSLNDKVHDITFDGIEFRHSAWNRASEKGYTNIQGDIVVDGYVVEGEDPRQKIPVHASIEVNNASYIKFLNCTFANLGDLAIGLRNGVSDIDIAGNTFKDLAAGAVTAGWINHASIQTGEQAPKNIWVHDNYIRDVAKEYSACAAISGYYTDRMLIEHNSIENVPYAGVNLAWFLGSGFRENSVQWNRISNYALTYIDTGAIYTMNDQPETIIAENYLLGGGGYAAIYPDETSGSLNISRNVIESPREQWLKIWSPLCHDIVADANHTTTRNYENFGTRCKVTNTKLRRFGRWPLAARRIISNSGPEGSVSP